MVPVGKKYKVFELEIALNLFSTEVETQEDFAAGRSTPGFPHLPCQPDDRAPAGEHYDDHHDLDDDQEWAGDQDQNHDQYGGQDQGDD